MSVLIKGMEMPTNCDNCWALDDYGDYPRCRITEEQRGYNFPIREKRMDKCPLVEVPPYVRCENCKYCRKEDEYEYWCYGFCSPARLVRKDDFCSYGCKNE